MYASSGLSFQVGLAALGFAWKRRDDAHFFTESLHAATRDLHSEPEERASSRIPHPANQMAEVRPDACPGPALPGTSVRTLWIQSQGRFGV